jgi:hypothetical protein
MKKVLGLILGMLLPLLLMGSSSTISQRMSPGDSMTVHVNFEPVKLSKDETNTQQIVNTMLENNTNATVVLSNSLVRLTEAVEQGIADSKLTKMDIVANQLGVNKDVLRKAFKRNNTIILLCLIPALLIILYTLYEFINIKGLDVKKTITGTALLTVYSLLGAGLLYVITSLIFNQQYFVIKNLLSALF